MDIVRKTMKTFLALFVILLLSNVIVSESFALQQVAGKITVEIKPGETKTFDWTLISDNDEQTSISISAEGKGAEFLSYERNILLEPRGSYPVPFTVTIPSDYPGGVELVPNLFATEFGEKGGTTVLNIQMLKIPSIVVAPNDNPELRTNQDSQMEASTVTSETVDPEPASTESEESEQSGGLTIQPSSQTDELKTTTAENTKSNGCLIATAAFGTELAPQVQLLREIRDNVLFSTGAGTTFMIGFNDFYYTFSPTVADLERQSPLFKEVMKTAITPMLSTMSILNYVNIDSEQEMLGYGIGVILLNIGMYFVAPTLIITKISKILNCRRNHV